MVVDEGRDYTGGRRRVYSEERDIERGYRKGVYRRKRIYSEERGT